MRLTANFILLLLEKKSLWLSGDYLQLHNMGFFFAQVLQFKIS